MFKCDKCEILKGEVMFLRDQVKSLQDRLLAMADAKAYGAVHAPSVEGSSEFYGTNDLIEAYNEYGEKILIDPKPKTNERII